MINAQNIFVTSQGAMHFVGSCMLTLGTKLHQASQLLSKYPISVHNLLFKWEEGVGVLSGFGYAPTLMGNGIKSKQQKRNNYITKRGTKKKAIMKLMSS